MRYERFEWLTIGVGCVAVFGSVGLTLMTSPASPGVDIIIEMLAQALLLVVLVAAVRWGRRGGFAAALAATVLYVVLRAPALVAGGATSEVVQLVLIHAVTYGAIGIIGGEFCGRIKYFFARLENAFNIDEDSRVYNERFIAKVIRSQVAQHRRYGQHFSVGIVTLSPALTEELRPSKITALIRTVAAHMREDVRLVDDVGRMGDGRFLLVFPHTDAAGAAVATERVRTGVRDVLGAKDGSVTSEVLCTPDDLDRIESLVPAPLPAHMMERGTV